MKKKLPLVLSFALASLIVVGQTGFAHGSGNDGERDNMMNGNGMTTMMENSNMSNMMEACMNFMQSFGEK